MKIKICGITNVDDAEAAIAAGADILGFIFYSKSPRYITPERTAAIVEALHVRHDSDAMPHTVGVFVNAEPMFVRQVLADAGLDLAQLHGDESPTDLMKLERRAYKALRPTSHEDAAAAAAAFSSYSPTGGPAFLIDAYDAHAYGGTGKVADWTTAAALAHLYPGLMLAGGLTPANVAAAVRAVRPWGIDVSSGVEAAPGRKDHAALTAFIANARASVVDAATG
jgi:phosphoribosylanthranilate isomerase